MIDLDDIHLTFGSAAGAVPVLRGIDLQVPAGQSLGVVGPSGSGKSTLMAVTAGLERPTRGAVRVADQDLTAMDEDQLARFRRDKIGIVFQAFHLIPTMTARDNVATPLELAGRADAHDAATTALTAVGLDGRAEHYPAQLSGGEQQRVALARAVVAQPALLLADEPTGNLDQATGAQVLDTLFALHDAGGGTLLIITHDPAVVDRCDRVVRMVDGRLAEGVDG